MVRKETRMEYAVALAVIEAHHWCPAVIGYILLKEHLVTDPEKMIELLEWNKFTDSGIALVLLGGMDYDNERVSAALKSWVKWDDRRIDHALTEAKGFYFYKEYYG